ncbi:hypothetical protein ACFXG1_24405 [Streptomyces sp. NPDC059248]|uniref:hypothetical protein n=1 Tax=Streptomyces sp. NPDC059248 TaxID=3346791 RepID=UPI00368289A6
MTQHPDVSEISDLTEGLLPPSRSEWLLEHLADCALCRDVRSSLEEIRELLGTVPGTPRMPTDIAERIDAALAAEALLAAGRPDNPDATGATGATDSFDAFDVSRETSKALVPPSTAGEPPPTATGPATRPTGRARGTTGPGRSPGRRRRRAVVLGAAFGVVAVGVSVLSFQALTSTDDDRQHAKTSSSYSSGPDEFSEATLEQRVRTLLAVQPVPEDGGTAMTTEEMPGSAPAGPGTEMGGPGPSVPPCVQRGTGRTAPPIAVERGRYQGSDAYLVVLPAPVDGRRVEAFVVDAGCVDSRSSAAGTVLLTHSYPRR